MFLNPSPTATVLAFKQTIEQDKVLFTLVIVSCERFIFGFEEIGKPCNLAIGITFTMLFQGQRVLLAIVLV